MGVCSKRVRICPLLCEHGYKADGESCVQIVCKSGFDAGDDNACERILPTKPNVRRAKPKQNTRPERSPEGGEPAQTKPGTSRKR